MNKLQNTATTLDKIVKILRKLDLAAIIIGCIIFVICFVPMIAMFTDAQGADYYNETTSSIISSGMMIKLSEPCVTNKYSVVLEYIDIIPTLLLTVLSYFVLGYIRNILQPMKDGVPFHNEISTNIKKLAIIILPYGIVSNITSLVTAILENRFTDYSAIIAASPIESIKSLPILDGGFLIAFFILIFVSYIFRYGETLQQQVDETL
ncbi:MAG: hypothetical protein NC122_04425 [Faecalibacterium sp.]|nr:hypothetical protein [Ruminococcus sp.]MCM1391783.1 hypothetical protein [Ruminococcus sp.]MCM1485429.1 hypothetical protein [Faecalibacterium sp.]